MKPQTVALQSAEISIGVSGQDHAVWVLMQAARASLLSDMTTSQARQIAAALNAAADQVEQMEAA
jgi:hypothetical protein